MLKLTRLDHRTVAINPDHIAWVEATPDTTLCLLGDRKVIVRETLDEVVERFVAARTRVGCTALGIQQPPLSNGRRSTSSSGRPSGYPSAPPPRIVGDDELGFGARRLGSRDDDGGE